MAEPEDDAAAPSQTNNPEIEAEEPVKPTAALTSQADENKAEAEKGGEQKS